MRQANATLKVRVSQIEILSPDIKRFTLRPSEGTHLPAFSGGSNVVLVLPHQHGSFRNAYSLMSSPYDTSRYQIAVRHVEDGRGGSRHLHEQVQEGDELEILRPVNLFPLSQHARLHIFIAGGIGITPIASQLAELHLRGTPYEVHFAVRSLKHAKIAQELQQQYGHHHIFIYATDQRQRLNIGNVLANRPLGSDVYVCGPKQMIDDTIHFAHSLGWTDSHIHYEHFVEQGSSGEAFEVTLARSGTRIYVSPDQSLLEAAEAAGHDIPYLCRGGACGMCETQVLALEGEILHSDDWLSDEEKQLNQKIMPCVSRAKCSNLVIDC